MEKLFRSALRNRSESLDVVPQLTTSGVLNHHVDMGSSVDRLVHAKDVTWARSEARADRSQLDDIGVADVFQNVYLAAHALHVLHILPTKIGLQYTKRDA